MLNSFYLAHPGPQVDLQVHEARHVFELRRVSKLDSFRAHPDQMSFGYVIEGNVHIKKLKSGIESRLESGMYFSLNGEWSISASGTILLFLVHGFSGLNSFGGPIEEYGRLRYIDNCTDSLLLPPMRLGDPCLNLLVFPPGIVQTPHTHPSFRAGCVVSGRGVCVTEEKEIPLAVGDFFFIPKDHRHSFNSDPKLGLRVIAFHPDSDFGPTDEVHPMINRTIIGPHET